ncbi:hypothetical protein GCM10027590_52540 [Nocardiopsis nanhaiensis]
MEAPPPVDNPFSTGAGVDYAQWRSPPDPQAPEHAAGATMSRSDLTPTGSGRIFYMLMPWILPALVFARQRGRGTSTVRPRISWGSVVVLS